MASLFSFENFADGIPYTEMEMPQQSWLADGEGIESIKGHATQSGTMSPEPAGQQRQLREVLA